MSKNLTYFPGMEEFSQPDHIFQLRLANLMHFSEFHMSVPQTVLLFLILHRTAQKTHPRGEAPSAWREHNLLAALERGEAAGLQLHLLPTPATKPSKSVFPT